MAKIKDSTTFIKVVMPIITLGLMALIAFQVLVIVQISSTEKRRLTPAFIENYGLDSNNAFKIMGFSEAFDKYGEEFFIKKLIREYIDTRYTYFSGMDGFDFELKEVKLNALSGWAEREKFQQELAQMRELSNQGGRSLEVIIPEKLENGVDNISRVVVGGATNRWTVKKAIFVNKVFGEEEAGSKSIYSINLDVNYTGKFNASSANFFFPSASMGFSVDGVERRAVVGAN